LIDQHPEALDPRALRTALGAFATGVTIVCTQDAEGQDVGITANSFNSVSLDPPMVLWSLSRKAMSLPSFQRNPYFAVHILAADQDGLSHRFATQGANKFAELPVERGFGNVPLIDGCSARFQCRTAFNYDGGDHVIFVGEVLAFDSYSRPPLLYHAGKYALAVEKHPAIAAAHGAVGEPDTGLNHDFLFGLLGRVHNQMYQQIQAELGKWALSDKDRSMLSVLGSRQHAGASVSGEADESAGAAIKRLVDAARAAEARSGRALLPEELQLLKQLLRRLAGERG
jgi:3-hydroxy-9,10-secoandrosta-1,3,5(10)-triene-9,17-dione monooxygenase reductase component